MSERFARGRRRSDEAFDPVHSDRRPPEARGFPTGQAAKVMAAFAAAEIQTRMIERAHQGGSGTAGDRSGLLKIGP